MSDRQEVFRGRFEECFKHFQKAFGRHVPKGSKDASIAKEPIAGFCGSTVKTVTRWLHGQGDIIGEAYIKLMCYLDMVGYRVIELEHMPQSRRNFFELIGFSLVTTTDAAAFLGYNQTSNLNRVLHGEFDVNRDKEQKMWEMWKEKKAELEVRKQDFSEKYRLSFSLVSSELDSNSTPGMEKPKAILQLLPARPSVGMISIMQGLLAMLEGANLNNGEVKQLKESTDVILKLSARLSDLSSRLITATTVTSERR